MYSRVEWFCWWYTRIGQWKNISALLDEVNVELKSWARWFRSNIMKVNTSKTKYVIFHTKGKSTGTNGKVLIYDDKDNDLNPCPALITPLVWIHSNHTDINSRSYKLLGIFFDKKPNLQISNNAIMNQIIKSHLLYKSI